MIRRIDEWLSEPGPLGLRREDWAFVVCMAVAGAALLGVILLTGGETGTR